MDADAAEIPYRLTRVSHAKIPYRPTPINQLKFAEIAHRITQTADKYSTDYSTRMYTHVNQLKFAEIAYRLTQVARKYSHCSFHCDEGIPNDELNELTNKILHTFQERVNSLKIESEVYLLVEHLKYYHDAQLFVEVPIQWDLYHDIPVTKKILIKRRGPLETSTSSSVTSYDAFYLALQVAKKITIMLSTIIFTQQIKSPDLLCLHVKKAILVLQAAFSLAPCFIGELMNVADPGDEIVRAPYDLYKTGIDFSSASACLYNLGGTSSFMISAIQCLHWVPELKSAIMKWHPLFEISCDHLLTAAMRDLFEKLDENVGCVEPRKFLQLFRTKFPRSSQLDDFNNQQDAKECWMQLLDTLSLSLKSSGFSSENFNIVKHLFGIKLISRCLHGGTPQEKSVGMLKWHVTNKVDHLHEGLRDYLETKIGEASPYSISGLPRYLTVEFNFGNRNASYKIDLLTVDLYDLCSDELREKLKLAREGVGFKASEEKCSGLEDQDVKMFDAAESEEQLTGVYDLFTVLSCRKKPYHSNIVSAGHYSAIVKYKKEWIVYWDEHRYWKETKYLRRQMRAGGFGNEVTLICVYKARELILCLGCLWIRVRKIKPVPKKGVAHLESGDEKFFPMVLFQILMCNEKEVYQQSIGAVCNLD